MSVLSDDDSGFQPPSYSQFPLPVETKKNTILQSHGRRPWYGEDGKPFSDAYVVGIAGGSGSGKTFVAQQIIRALGYIPTVVILSQDSFYKSHSPSDLKMAFANEYDFDHPNAIDMPMFAACLFDLKSRRQSNIPVYSFSEHQRLPDSKYLYGAAVIIAEGILALHDPDLRALYDLKIFVQSDSDLMLARRLRRDVEERGRDVSGILDQYLRFVKPSFDNFVQPSAKFADIIVPGSDNTVAINLIATHIRRELQARRRNIRPKIARGLSEAHGNGLSQPASLEDLNVYLLEQTPQLKGIYTILRNRLTSKGDFIFYADRLATFLCEKAMSWLPFCPSGDYPAVCGVSILRSGGLLERGLRRVIRDVRLGSLLIQSDPESGEPLFLHGMLPRNLTQRHEAEQSWVFLLDAQIGTGAAAMMAIRILLDHGVRSERIVFISLLIARSGGIAVVHKAFPGVRFITGAVDPGLRHVLLDTSTDEKDKFVAWVIEPGMGMIGDRYYL